MSVAFAAPDALASSAATFLASIPPPPGRSLDLGPLHVRFYALAIIAGIVAATWLARRRWRADGGDPDLAMEVALWGALAGIVGGRLYFDVTTPDQMGDEWYAPFAVWQGGLGIWGALVAGVLAGALVVRRRGASVTRFMDAAAPAIPVGQGIGRVGNWFNQELFGGPTHLPWGLEVDPSHRPDRYLSSTTFHPTFLYEMLWNLGVAGVLIVLGRRRRIRPPGLFCLYVTLYCTGRVFWETLRVDPSSVILGQRLNFWVALAGAVAGALAFVIVQRRSSAVPLRVSRSPS